MIRRSVKELFEAKINKNTNSGCWEWTAAKTKQGYGQFGFKGQMVGAHRVSYILYVGEIPGGLQVLHKCNNPSCVNPGHLYAGTFYDNIQDRKKSAIKPYCKNGTNHHNASLTREKLTKLREMYATGLYTHRGLAFKFGVSKTTVGYALAGKTYPWE